MGMLGKLVIIRMLSNTKRFIPLYIFQLYFNFQDLKVEEDKIKILSYRVKRTMVKKFSISKPRNDFP